MNILQVNTGNKKLDEAYKRMQIHISTFDTFESFYSYFNDIVKSDDHESLNKWLLKVLHHEFRYGRTEVKHDFDVLLEKVGDKNKANLELWLKTKLEEVGGNNV